MARVRRPVPKLSKEDADKFIAHMDSFGDAPTCPVCRSTDWAVGENLVYPVTIGGLLNPESPVYPTVQLISKPCGYTMYFNAVSVGLHPAFEEPGDAEPQ